MKTKSQTLISVPLELLQLLLPDAQIAAMRAFAGAMTAAPAAEPAPLPVKPVKKPHGNAGKKRPERRAAKDWIDLLATRKVNETREAFAKRIGTSDAYIYQIVNKFPEVKRMPAWNDK